MKLKIGFVTVLGIIVTVLFLSSCDAIGGSYAIPTAILDERVPTMTQAAKVATQSALELQSSQAKAQAQEIDAQRTQLAAELERERREMTQIVLAVTQTADTSRIMATQAALIQETERAWGIVVAQLTETAENAKQTEAVSDAKATSTAVFVATQDAMYVAQQEAINRAQIAQAEAEKEKIELAIERQRAINEFSAYVPLILMAVFLALIGFLIITYTKNAQTQPIYDADGNLTAIIRRDGSKIQLIQPGRAVQPVIVIDGSKVESPLLSDGISQLATTGRDQMLHTIRSAGMAENALPAGVYKSVVDETTKPIEGQIIQNQLLNGHQIKVVEAKQLKAWVTDVNHRLVEEIIDAEAEFMDENGEDDD